MAPPGTAQMFEFVRGLPCHELFCPAGAAEAHQTGSQETLQHHPRDVSAAIVGAMVRGGAPSPARAARLERVIWPITLPMRCAGVVRSTATRSCGMLSNGLHTPRHINRISKQMNPNNSLDGFVQWRRPARAGMQWPCACSLPTISANAHARKLTHCRLMGELLAPSQYVMLLPATPLLLRPCCHT